MGNSLQLFELSDDVDEMQRAIFAFLILFTTFMNLIITAFITFLSLPCCLNTVWPLLKKKKCVKIDEEDVILNKNLNVKGKSSTISPSTDKRHQEVENEIEALNRQMALLDAENDNINSDIKKNQTKNVTLEAKDVKIDINVESEMPSFVPPPPPKISKTKEISNNLIQAGNNSDENDDDQQKVEDKDYDELQEMDAELKALNNQIASLDNDEDDYTEFEGYKDTQHVKNESVSEETNNKDKDNCVEFEENNDIDTQHVKNESVPEDTTSKTNPAVTNPFVLPTRKKRRRSILKKKKKKSKKKKKDKEKESSTI